MMKYTVCSFSILELSVTFYILLIFRGLARPTVHPTPINETVFFWYFFMCFWTLDMLRLNKLLRTTGFEPLYLLYLQEFFFRFWGNNKNMNGNNFVLKYHKYPMTT